MSMNCNTMICRHIVQNLVDYIILSSILVSDPSPLIQHQPSQGRALPADDGSAAPAVVAPIAVPREYGVTGSCLDGEYWVTTKICNRIPT